MTTGTLTRNLSVIGRVSSICVLALLFGCKQGCRASPDKLKESCLSGRVPAACDLVQLSAEEKDRAEKSRLEYNLKQCLDGGFGCDLELLDESQRPAALEARRKRNFKHCLLSKETLTCDYNELTEPERAQADGAEMVRNLSTCMTGSERCRLDLLSDQQKPQAEQARRDRNLADCLTGMKSASCDHTKLTEKEETAVRRAEADYNLKACMEGRKSYDCDLSLLSGEDKLRAIRARHRFNLESCLSRSSLDSCDDSDLKEDEKAVVYASRRRLCFEPGHVDDCDERALPTDELMEFRRHLSPFQEGSLDPDLPPMGRDERMAALQQHLSPAYLRGLFERANASALQGLTAYVGEQRDPLSDQYGLVVCWLRFQKDRVTIHVRDVRETASQLSDAYQRLYLPGDLALSTGGFWITEPTGRRSPIGAVVSNGALRNPIAPWSSGGFLFQAHGSIAVLRASDGLRKDTEEALQSKPVLIWNGTNAILGDDKERRDRIGIGILQDGSVILVGAFRSDHALSLVEFADAFLVFGPTRETVTSAINFDGGPAAHLYVPALRRHWGASGHYFLNNLIAISASDSNDVLH